MINNQVDTAVEKDSEYEGEDVSRVAYIYICNSSERWLISNSDEQLGNTEIDLAIHSGGSGNVSPTVSTVSQLIRRRLANKTFLLVRRDSGTAHRVIFPSSDVVHFLCSSMTAAPHDPTSQ